MGRDDKNPSAFANPKKLYSIYVFSYVFSSLLSKYLISWDIARLFLIAHAKTIFIFLLFFLYIPHSLRATGLGFIAAFCAQSSRVLLNKNERNKLRNHLCISIDGGICVFHKNMFVLKSARCIILDAHPWPLVIHTHKHTVLCDGTNISFVAHICFCAQHIKNIFYYSGAVTMPNNKTHAVMIFCFHLYIYFNMQSRAHEWNLNIL